MAAQYCGGLWGEVVWSEVWPSWEDAAPQGRKGGARNILVWCCCLVQWLFPLLASLPLHNTSDVCVFFARGSDCPHNSPLSYLFEVMFLGVTSHVLTHPERPHLKTAFLKAEMWEAWPKKTTPKHSHGLLRKWGWLSKAFLLSIC